MMTSANKTEKIIQNQKRIAKKRGIPYLRTFVQVFFVALIFAISINHTLEESYGMTIPFLSAASLHAICPFGGVVTLWQFITTGNFIQKIHSSALILMFAALLLGILVGPVICGWVCPFGSIQEWLGKIGKKLFKKRFNHFVPEKLDRYLRFTRYILMVLVIVNTAISGTLMFQDIDPYYALFNFWTSEIAISAYVILGVTVLLSLLVERPWCKYACPYGAVMGLTNLIRIFPVRRNKNTCISCKKCDVACPMNINVSNANVVRDHQCISCMKCTSDVACPVADTVLFATKAGIK